MVEHMTKIGISATLLNHVIKSGAFWSVMKKTYMVQKSTYNYESTTETGNELVLISIWGEVIVWNTFTILREDSRNVTITNPVNKRHCGISWTITISLVEFCDNLSYSLESTILIS